ncbi:MAG: methionyl-tRNA formyltransferase [Oscillospiraceae bacterium]|jgi:methionyl-tRNA formyltransferase|nr:methionyl-tRNA formyltransferase [Oscillospiraceae bacterium]
MRIAFFGTPDFARASLAALLDMPEHTVAGVFTQPDRAKGRGMKLTASPVKELAERHGIPVFQPVKMRDGTALTALRSLKPDLAAVVAYGRMLPKDMLDEPGLGCINLHASLLPELRGAAPIQWAVARGFAKTGVTTQKMAEECDAGDILLREETPIGADETAGDLHDRLRDLGASLLQKTIRAIADGTANPAPQDHAKATYAPILKKEDGVIDLSRPAAEIGCLIRAMNPWPGAALGALKVHRARIVPGGSGAKYIRCGDGGVLELLEVQAPGGRRMSAEDYFRGARG